MGLIIVTLIAAYGCAAAFDQIKKNRRINSKIDFLFEWTESIEDEIGHLLAYKELPPELKNNLLEKRARFEKRRAELEETTEEDLTE